MKRSRRSDRLRYRQIQEARTRARNHPRKQRERARRDARLVERVRSGSLPYTPEVMSWLSVKLDKGASRITAEDVKNLIE